MPAIVKIPVLLLLFWLPAAFAAHTPEADTFLWKLSKSGRPDSYLLGTIHVGKVGAVLPPAYQNALKASRVLVVESNADELAMPQHRQEAQAVMLLMADTRPLSQSLGRIRTAALQHILKKGEEPIDIDGNMRLKPWALWLDAQSRFTPKGYSYRYGIDNLLIQTANEQGKTVISLERSEPLHYFNAVPEAAVLRAFDSFILHHRAYLQDQHKLIRDYEAQNAKALWADIADRNRQLRHLPRRDRALWSEFMYGKLLTERNQRWLPQIIGILPQQPALIAVGSAHLFGEQGLIRRLRQAGYTVSPVNAR